MTSCIDVPVLETSRCPFCAYLAGERDYAIVVRDGLVAIMVTQEQRGKPHVLVVPERHCSTILDLCDDEATAVMHAARAVARAIDLEYCRPGIVLWQNNGVPAHQTIAHVH